MHFRLPWRNNFFLRKKNGFRIPNFSHLKTVSTLMQGRPKRTAGGETRADGIRALLILETKRGLHKKWKKNGPFFFRSYGPKIRGIQKSKKKSFFGKKMENFGIRKTFFFLKNKIAPRRTKMHFALKKHFFNRNSNIKKAKVPTFCEILLNYFLTQSKRTALKKLYFSLQRMRRGFFFYRKGKPN